ncbi:MAG: hypothetical protein HC794_09530 [Nitrospiraceae bacterium]|nr:hypothetical protein [Nitrospiraceae bacterium]
MTQAAQHRWIEQALVALNGAGRRSLIEFLQRQRWFGGKGKSLADVRVVDATPAVPGHRPSNAGDRAR